jgi:hypothetical protein
MTPFNSERERRAAMAKRRLPTSVRGRAHRLRATRRDLHIELGDFRDKLPGLSGVRTFFTDPPFNLGYNYGPVNDRKSTAQYQAMMRDLARLTYQAADKNASLFVHHYPEELAKLWPILTEQWKFRQWITWCFTGRTGTRKDQWNRCSRAILWLTKGNPPFNPHATVRPYLTSQYEKRARARGGPVATPLFDWWVIPQIRPTDPEHCGYHHQVPSEVIRRCVLATTKPGDLVADPFAGTGSTVKVAAAAGRRGWGCDANPETAPHWGFLRGGITGENHE